MYFFNYFPECYKKHRCYFLLTAGGPRFLSWLGRLSQLLAIPLISIRHLRVVRFINERSQSSITLHRSYDTFANLGMYNLMFLISHYFETVHDYWGLQPNPLFSLVTHLPCFSQSSETERRETCFRSRICIRFALRFLGYGKLPIMITRVMLYRLDV